MKKRKEGPTLKRHVGPHHQPGRYVHAVQLLEQQFARVGNLRQPEIGLVGAVPAVVDPLFVVVDRDHAAGRTNVHLELVRIVVDPSLRKGCRPVREHAIALHLAELCVHLFPFRIIISRSISLKY